MARACQPQYPLKADQTHAGARQVAAHALRQTNMRLTYHQMRDAAFQSGAHMAAAEQKPPGKQAVVRRRHLAQRGHTAHKHATAPLVERNRAANKGRQTLKLLQIQQRKQHSTRCR
jgi:hypothetical protein